MDTGNISTEQPTAPKPKRRWYQYSLRTLLIFVTLFALACSWFAVKMQQARRQREAVEAIEKLGGEVWYETPNDKPGFYYYPKHSPNSTWLRKILGNDFFDNVNILSYSNTNATDLDLTYLKELTQIHTLDLYNTKITNDGIPFLKKIINLHTLSLNSSKVTYNGLIHLKDLAIVRQ
jgi:hypothetical protein